MLTERGTSDNDIMTLLRHGGRLHVCYKVFPRPPRFHLLGLIGDDPPKDAGTIAVHAVHLLLVQLLFLTGIQVIVESEELRVQVLDELEETDDARADDGLALLESRTRRGAVELLHTKNGEERLLFTFPDTQSLRSHLAFSCS